MKLFKFFAWASLVTKLKATVALHGGGSSLCNDLKTVCIDGGYCSKTKGQKNFCECLDSSVNCTMEASDLCSRSTEEHLNSPSQILGFCINKGQCATSGDGRPYCVCNESIFTGPHCEISAERYLQQGIPTAAPAAFTSNISAIPSMAPSKANQSDAPNNSQPSLAPSSFNDTSLRPSLAPSIGTNSSAAPTSSASPSTSFAPTTVWPSTSNFPSTASPTATWFPTASAIPTITSLPTMTAIPSTSEPSNNPSPSPSLAPSLATTTANPTKRPVQERPPIPEQPTFTAPVPYNDDDVPEEKHGLPKGASIGIGLLAVAAVFLTILFYTRRRGRYAQAGRINDGDLELTTNYLDDQDDWANQRPLTAGSRRVDDELL